MPKKKDILSRLLDLEKINVEKDEQIKTIIHKFVKLDKYYKNQVQDTHEDNFKCDKCDFITKNAAGLKVRLQAKHTKQNKMKCSTCGFSCESKELLKTHNDKPCPPRK